MWSAPKPDAARRDNYKKIRNTLRYIFEQISTTLTRKDANSASVVGQIGEIACQGDMLVYCCMVCGSHYSEAAHALGSRV